MKKRVGQFLAKRIDGTPEIILMFREIVRGDALTEGPTHSLGILSLTTARGEPVRKIGPGKYQIEEFDPVPLTSVDDNAP